MGCVCLLLHAHYVDFLCFFNFFSERPSKTLNFFHDEVSICVWKTTHFIKKSIIFCTLRHVGFCFYIPHSSLSTNGKDLYTLMKSVIPSTTDEHPFSLTHNTFVKRALPMTDSQAIAYVTGHTLFSYNAVSLHTGSFPREGVRTALSLRKESVCKGR
jgi:hypothetical protein